MRKLILILLIAIIACVEVDTTPKDEVSDFKELLDLLDLDADSVELGWDWIKNIGKKIKNAFNKVTGKIKEAADYLDRIGVLDTLISLAKTGAKLGANALCSTYFSPAVCTPVVEIVFSMI